MGTTPISALAPQVANRLQDPTSVYWNLNNEVYASLVEAISELMLIVGRPTIQFNTKVTLEANTVWQPMPANMLAITNIRTDKYSLWNTTLRTLDYLQGSWSSAWESDTAPAPLRWAPLGFNYFVVHPAPETPITVYVAGVTNPITGAWPPTGAETVPFHDEFFEALEMYAAHYCRIKDMGADFQEGMMLYQTFLTLAQRLTTIEDRRDAWLFTQGLGVPTAPPQNTLR